MVVSFRGFHFFVSLNLIFIFKIMFTLSLAQRVIFIQ